MPDSKNQHVKQMADNIQTQIPFSLKIDDPPPMIQIPITPIQDLSFCIISTEIIEIPPPPSKSKEIYCFCCHF